MIVKLEVTASEKIAARSQYEPNNYSVAISVEHLDVSHPDELQAQAETLFRRVKAAIATAKLADGIGEAKSVEEPRDSQARAPRNGEHLASAKQVDLIHSLAKRAGMGEADFHKFAVRAVGGMESLSRFDASRLINALQQAPVAANGNGRAR